LIKLDIGNTDAFLEGIDRGLTRSLYALKTILARSGPGADMLGWLDLARTPQRELRAIEDAAKRIQDENDLLVVIGIGGSYLGARAAIEALPEQVTFPVLFAGNSLSPDYHARLLDSLEGKKFALCVISKSGTTTEPAIAFRILSLLLRERIGDRRAAKSIIAITDPAKGALRRIAEGEGYQTFSIPPGVGGRFSVLSPVGLFPCAAAAIPIEELLSGAAWALDRFTREVPKNDALQYAARRTLLFERGIAIEVLSTFSPELGMLCEWWKQLAGESEGKQGKGLFPASAVMTTDLHSLGQYLQQGVRNILETFLVSLKAGRKIAVPTAPGDPDGLDYLVGRTMGEINRKAFEGTRAAHEAGGLPVMTVELSAIAPETIGAVFMFFEMAIAVSGHLLGINPFDQPGVEEYKRRMFRLLGKPDPKK
jgi:glucose-6-phosphate isomerase